MDFICKRNNLIEWLYTAEGTKVQKKTTQNGLSSTKDYLADMELHNEDLQTATIVKVGL